MTAVDIEQLATFHDAELRHVSYKAATTKLELGFEKADGEFSVVTLSQVAAFRVVDMQTQNVVSRLLVQGRNVHLTESEVGERINWISMSCAGEQLAAPSKLDALAARVNSGQSLLFILEPSWGAELMVIAEALSS